MIIALYSVTREGGILKSVNPRLPVLNLDEHLSVLIGIDHPLISVGVPIWNGGGDTISWTAQNNSPDYLDLEATSGTFASTDEIPLVIKIQQPGHYDAQITVDGGRGWFENPYSGYSRGRRNSPALPARCEQVI